MRIQLQSVYEWLCGVRRPKLRDGEYLVRDRKAFHGGGAIWQFRTGRLLLTTQRLIFVPGFPLLLPIHFLGARFELEWSEIVSAKANHRLLKAMRGGLFTRGIVEIETNAGKKFWVQTDVAEEVESFVCARTEESKAGTSSTDFY